MTIVEVAVAAPVFKTYSYELPLETLALSKDDLLTLVGRRIYIPFGNRKITGYIIGLSQKDTDNRELKEIYEILDDRPLFHQEMVELFKWVAEYYHYPLGSVIQTALPGGLTVQSQKIIQLSDNKCQRQLLKADNGAKDSSWIRKLAENGALSPRESRKVLGAAGQRKTLAALAESGLVSVVNSRSRELVRKKTETCYRLTEKGLNLFAKMKTKGASSHENMGLEVDNTLLSKGEQKTFSHACNILQELNKELIPRKELIARYPYCVQVIPGLIEKNLFEVKKQRIFRTPYGDLLPHLEAPRQLTDEQRQAVARITSSIEEQHCKTVLLHGITGSGKTEVYLRAAEHATKVGKRVLVLVPEIALATQIEAHFVSRFGDEIALLHSALSAGERYDEWDRVCRGERSIVIGARSAVFAPLENLGLIIVDEEHDSSFKQDDQLRYNGRDIAILRGRMCQAVTVLGSATPSITSFHHTRSKKFELIEMKNRIGISGLPKVSVVDLKRRENQKALFSKPFTQALETTFHQGNQSILLINRRGFSASVICRECGSMVKCNHCNVTLNLHKSRMQLVCHYCGFQLPAKTRCTSCGSDKLVPVGFGTERVVEEVEKIVPEARIARLDSDVASDRKRFMSILHSVREKEIDILVGTQMIAKGLHFPEVTLVGVVWADGGLGFPDFRAAEKTFQLIAQVTGRAGRGDKPGQVIIQTMQPQHYAISLAAAHDYQELVHRELLIRKEAGYPPFTRLVSLRIEGCSEKRVRAYAFEVASKARSWCQASGGDKACLQILGPAPAPIERIRDVYRWQVLLKGADLSRLHDLVRVVMSMAKKRGSEKLLVDVDPENML
ncbi:MAG: primosomal protein N' [Desulfocapsaceae bacterium]|jgi:primosomal protein N' (replication factor Y)|nr:primosomal protein N' [Desulfocapsaceae bacterium]